MVGAYLGLLHELPDYTELPAKHEGWECDEKQAEDQQWKGDQSSKERPWCDFAVSYGRDSYRIVIRPEWWRIGRELLTDQNKPTMVAGVLAKLQRYDRCMKVRVTGDGCIRLSLFETESQ